MTVYYVMNVTQGTYYAGGSYGGRMSDFPKFYRRQKDAEKVIERLRWGFGSSSRPYRGSVWSNAHGGVEDGDKLELRSTEVTL